MKYFITVMMMLCIVNIVSAQQGTQSQLNTEFLTDPTARGYATCAGAGGLTGVNVNDQCVLDKFNAPCTNNAACKVDQVVSREILYGNLDQAELQTLAGAVTSGGTTADDRRFRLLGIAMANSSFDMNNSNVRQSLKNIFPSANYPVTNAAITALQQKNVPRSQTVCSRSGTLNDVSCGLRGVGCQ